jgi:hypothetical protein
VRPLRILGAAMGECVHVAGVLNFLAVARRHGHHAEFLGPAVPVVDIVDAIRLRRPDVAALGYRLTPEAAGRLFTELADRLAAAGLAGTRLWFGGPEPVAEAAGRSGIFEVVFGRPGDPDPEAWFAAPAFTDDRVAAARDLLARRRALWPRPVIRHHFGLPSLERTREGIACIAEEGVVDVISLGPDQNAQEHFFAPGRMDPAQDGAGGVPLRTPDDLSALKEAADAGNRPLLRCYSGTNDLLSWARMLRDTIANAWCAVPVFWYSELDGRSRRTLEQAIAENQELARWSADHDTPVERNDQNQWALRSAHDAVQVAAAALAVRLSSMAGVRTHILQMMLNTPVGIAPSMDLAKMAAMEHLARDAAGPDAAVLRQARAGLFSLPPDPMRALGQLASSVRTSMALSPDILHVVGHTEAHHAIEAAELVDACRLAGQVVDDSLLGLPDPMADPRVSDRRDRIVDEALVLLEAISQRYPGAMEGDPSELAGVVRTGMFDAPHLVGSRAGRGDTVTVVDGGCDAVDPSTGLRIDEATRLATLVAANA